MHEKKVYNKGKISGSVCAFPKLFSYLPKKELRDVKKLGFAGKKRINKDCLKVN